MNSAKIFLTLCPDARLCKILKRIRNIESCTYTTFKFNFELRSIFSSKSRTLVYFDINLRLKPVQLTYTKFPVKKF